jgi:HAD superfamily hydrolase (TIGR01549 family)
MQLKAILFDLWGTLIIDPPHRSQPRYQWRAENVREILARHNLEFPFETVEAALSATGAGLSALNDEGIDGAALGRVHLFLRMLELSPEFSPEIKMELQEAICSMHPLHKPELAAGGLEVVREAKAMGLATALVSNAGLTTAPHLRLMLVEYGLSDYLDTCVFSDEMEIAKPNADIFFAALSRLGVEPPEAVFVGDSPHNDIFGARQAGLLAVQVGYGDEPPRTGYTESDGARPNAYITSLSELLPAIAEFAELPHRG